MLVRVFKRKFLACEDAGKAPDDPQNTEGTLTDNTDSRVGLKDTTDTTPGYFYKNEVRALDSAAPSLGSVDG